MLSLLLLFTTAIAPTDAPVADACGAAAAMERSAPELCPLLAGVPDAGSAEVVRFAEHFGRAGVLIETGELDFAEDELRRAARASDALAGLFDFAVEERLGDLRRNQWRLDEAVVSYRSVLDAAALRAGERADVARKLAEVESLRGHLEEALEWNAKASALVDATAEPSLAIRITLQRATLFFDAGREREAGALRTDALGAARKSNRPDDVIAVLVDIANAHLLRGQYGEALTYFDDVLDLVQRSNRPEMEAYAWSVVSMLYVLVDDDSSAQAALDRGAALAERSSSPLPRAMIGAAATARRFVAQDAGGPELLAAFSSLMSMPIARSTAGPADVPVLDGALDAEVDPAIPLPLRGISKPLRALQGLRLLGRGFTAEAREILFEVLGETSNLDFRNFYLSMIGGSYILEQNLEEAIRYYAESIDVLELVARELRGEEMLSGFFGKQSQDRLRHHHQAAHAAWLPRPRVVLRGTGPQSRIPANDRQPQDQSSSRTRNAGDGIASRANQPMGAPGAPRQHGRALGP